jgi:hypothetical protein
LESFPDRDARGNYTENFTHLQIQARLSLGSVSYQEGDDIPLEFILTNRGKEVVRIFPAHDWKKTFQLQIRDEDNRIYELDERHPIQPGNPKYNRDPQQNRRNTNQNLVGDLSKEIALNPGESFSFRILLQEYYLLLPEKKYRITGYFYPNGTESSKNLLLGGTDSEGSLSFMKSENAVAFFLEARRKDRMDMAVRIAENQNVGISPEETVFLFLGAELKKNWSNHFKWIRFEDFILAYDRFSGAYLNAGPRDREAILEEFKKYLSGSPSGRLKYYKVLDVSYPTERESRVKVYVERLEERVPTRYEYEYVLKREEYPTRSDWRIHGVMVRVRK